VGKKLYVGSLSYNTTEANLERFFSQVGVVDSVRIVTDRDTGRAKGFGFVEMSTDAEATRAINELNGAELDGRALIVSEARHRKAGAAVAAVAAVATVEAVVAVVVTAVAAAAAVVGAAVAAVATVEDAAATSLPAVGVITILIGAGKPGTPGYEN